MVGGHLQCLVVGYMAAALLMSYESHASLVGDYIAMYDTRVVMKGHGLTLDGFRVGHSSKLAMPNFIKDLLLHASCNVRAQLAPQSRSLGCASV
jgi:hypothetical protein